MHLLQLGQNLQIQRSKEISAGVEKKKKNQTQCEPGILVVEQ